MATAAEREIARKAAEAAARIARANRVKAGEVVNTQVKGAQKALDRNKPK